MPPLQRQICLLTLSIGQGSAVQAQGPGYYRSDSSSLYLTEQGTFLYQMAFGIAGRGVSFNFHGRWEERADGRICLEILDSPAVLVIAFEDLQQPKGVRVVTVEEPVGESVLLAVGEQSSTTGLAWHAQRFEEQELEIGPAITHLFVQVPARDASTILGVPLRPEYNHYRVVAGNGSQSTVLLDLLTTLAEESAGAQPTLDPCIKLATERFVHHGRLPKEDSDDLDASIRKLIDPQQVEIGDVNYVVLKPTIELPAPRPSSVLHYATDVYDADELYDAITTAFNQFAPSSSTFDQYETDRERSDLATGLVLGHAGGNRSASDFEVSVQLGKSGEIAITTRSARPLPEVNAEDGIGHQMAGRIGYVLDRTLQPLME